MKFIGIRNSHDANISYSDGTTVRYLKFERLLQQKHYDWYTNDLEKKDILPSMIKKSFEIFNINPKELDGICISTAGKKYQDNQFWSQFGCPVRRIDHHYAHALSIWPVIDYDKVNVHFVLDGEGDNKEHTSTFIDDRLVNFITNKNIGLSAFLYKIGETLDIKGYSLDRAGKLMALKSCHNIPLEQITANIEKHTDLNYIDLSRFINLMKVLQPDDIDVKQKLINLVEYAHVFCGYTIPKYMSDYATSTDIISYTGGTGQNTWINSKIRDKFPNLNIAPHCPDDGISLGCIEYLRRLHGQPPFDKTGYPFWQSDQSPESIPSDETIDRTAELLARGKIVGWYQGNGEIGPRALGNRSILMDPSIRDGKNIINNRIKHREAYRPFGASVLAEKTSEYFRCDFESPYMLYVVDCVDDRFPSITHVDGTCRIQTVNEDKQYESYRQLLSRFERKTGIPMLLNTSLNINGKPIAGHISDAVDLFDAGGLDAMVIGNNIVER